ncbi:hypothetical protein CR513_53922, partial [Mucuna pruriens]
MHQLDVKSAFLNGPLEEEVYGFVVKGEENKVYKLKKILNGLKQALRAWNKRIDDFLSEATIVDFKGQMMNEFKMLDSFLISWGLNLK